MNAKIGRSVVIAICVLLLILLLAGSGTAAWGTPEQNSLRETIPPPAEPGIFVPIVAKNAGQLTWDNPACRP